jgi:hypothetical protein
MSLPRRTITLEVTVELHSEDDAQLAADLLSDRIPELQFPGVEVVDVFVLKNEPEPRPSVLLKYLRRPEQP